MHETRRGGCRFLAACATVVALVAWWAPPVLAAPPPREVKRAEALFAEGWTLMDAQRFAEACPKFEQSWAIDPAVGTLLSLAACHEALGKLEEAWQEYSEGVGVAGSRGTPAQVEQARSRLTNLEQRLSFLTVTVPAALHVPGMVVKWNATAIARPRWGTKIPLRPGTYRITAVAPGRREWRIERTLAAGAEARIEVPLLEEVAPAAGPPPWSGGAAAAAPVTAVERPPRRDEAWRPPLYVTWIALGVVAAAAGTGGYFGSRVLDRGVNAEDSKAPALGATVCFSIAGVAAAIAGGVLLWRAVTPRRARKVEVGLGPGAFSLRSQF